MNESSFLKVIKTIKSCANSEQHDQCFEWVGNLRRLYTFSRKQSLILNDTFLLSDYNLV